MAIEKAGHQSLTQEGEQIKTRKTASQQRPCAGVTERTKKGGGGKKERSKGDEKRKETRFMGREEKDPVLWGSLRYKSAISTL